MYMWKQWHRWECWLALKYLLKLYLFRCSLDMAERTTGITVCSDTIKSYCHVVTSHPEEPGLWINVLVEVLMGTFWKQHWHLYTILPRVPLYPFPLKFQTKQVFKFILFHILQARCHFSSVHLTVLASSSMISDYRLNIVKYVHSLVSLWVVKRKCI